MSIVKTYDVFCDGEDCINWAENATDRCSASTRKNAKRLGWIKVGNKDYCPHCKPKYQNRKVT